MINVTHFVWKSLEGDEAWIYHFQPNSKANKRAMMALDCSPESCSPQMNPCTNLVEVHKEMLKTKYQSSTPSSFRGEKF